MIIARWQVKARFGMKQQAIAKLKEWWESIGKAIGQTDVEMSTASVGLEEAIILIDVRVKNMSELDAQWSKLAERTDHQKFATELEPLIVSGSTKWDILRVIE